MLNGFRRFWSNSYTCDEKNAAGNRGVHTALYFRIPNFYAAERKYFIYSTSKEKDLRKNPGMDQVLFAFHLVIFAPILIIFIIKISTSWINREIIQKPNEIISSDHSLALHVLIRICPGRGRKKFTGYS